MGLMLGRRERAKDPVNGGEVGSGAAPDCRSEQSPLYETSWFKRERSSRRGNDWMRFEIHEDGKVENITQSDVRTGENPWNGTKELGVNLLPVACTVKRSNSKSSTREKVEIQPPSSTSAVVTTG